MSAFLQYAFDYYVFLFYLAITFNYSLIVSSLCVISQITDLFLHKSNQDIISTILGTVGYL